MWPGRGHHFYKNLGNKKFVNVSAELFSKDEPNNYLAGDPLFFDCDSDGDEDLFLLTTSCPRIFINEDGKSFKEKGKKSGIDVCRGSTSNVVDINNDNYLDIVIADYHLIGHRNLADHFDFASTQNQKVAVYLGKNNCTFEKTEIKGLSSEDIGFTHAIGVIDTRNINRKDLWFVTDYGTDRVFLDNGDGSYTKVDDFKKSYQRHGMAFDIMYPDNEALPMAYISHIFEPGLKIEGNALWKYDGSRFKDYGREMNISRCGHAWGGTFLDADMDGDEDLFILNGYYSNSKEKSYSYNIAQLAMSHKGHLRDQKKWPAFKDSSYFGYEKSCIFIKEKDTFLKFTGENDFALNDLDGRAISYFDPDNNGELAIAVANQQQEFQLFSIKQKSSKNWIGFSFKGRCAHKNAFGTSLTLYYNNISRKKYFYPTNGFTVQSYNRLFFGLGTLEEIDKVELEWPSGFKEVVKNLSINKYHELEEGKDCVAYKKN